VSPDRSILVTGAAGILGQAVLAELAARHRSARGWTRADADLSQPASLPALVAALAPAGIIHCGAWTLVDDAEDQPAACRVVNVDASAALATAAATLGVPFIYISSGGVFDGLKPTPYDERDTPAPRTVYHRSKHDGELAVRAAHPASLVARVGWLYGGDAAQRRNFVAARLREAAASPVIRSSTEQFGTPTWTRDAATRLVDHLLARHAGVVHVAPAGPMASRLDYVRTILSAAGLTTTVEPAAPGAFARKADVPANEALASVQAPAWGLPPLRDWRDALAAYVAELTPTMAAARA
jgi:dTDP-4-dehydrorhamnose reductase